MAKKPKQHAAEVAQDSVVEPVPALVEPQVEPVEPVPSGPAIRFQRVMGNPMPVPSRATPGSAGLDLCAASPVSLVPGARALVGTGFAVEIPDGHAGHIRPRSGLARDHGVVAFGGTIDADYRGELCVLLFNLGAEKVTIERGQRIAQLVVAPVSMLPAADVEVLGITERGTGGFGSSGK